MGEESEESDGGASSAALSAITCSGCTRSSRLMVLRRRWMWASCLLVGDESGEVVGGGYVGHEGLLHTRDRLTPMLA